MKFGQGWSGRDHEHIRRRTVQFCRRSLCTFGIARAPAILDPDVATITPAQLLE
jgi:hypothetical protein